MKLELIPIVSKKRFGRFDLSKVIADDIIRNGAQLKDGDVIIVSSKFVSMAEGRYVRLGRVRPSKKAVKLAKKYDIDSHMAELVLRESDFILGGLRGFLLAISKGTLAPNAGVDKSNVPKGLAILYPRDPQATSRNLRSDLMKSFDLNKSANLGVVISDSRVTPLRLGTVGVALAASGFRAVLDFRGKKDLFGNKLKVTIRAIGDQFATAAQLLMGEAKEATPVVLVRGAAFIFEEKCVETSMNIDQERCLIIQGLRNPFNG